MNIIIMPVIIRPNENIFNITWIGHNNWHSNREYIVPTSVQRSLQMAIMFNNSPQKGPSLFIDVYNTCSL